MAKVYRHGLLRYKFCLEWLWTWGDTWEPAATLKKQVPGVAKQFEQASRKDTTKKLQNRDVVSQSRDGRAIWVRRVNYRKMTLEPRTILMQDVRLMIQEI